MYDTGRSTPGARCPGTNSGLVYRTYSALATTMNKSIGKAKLSIEPPKVHALTLEFTPGPLSLSGRYYRA